MVDKKDKSNNMIEEKKASLVALAEVLQIDEALNKAREEIANEIKDIDELYTDVRQHYDDVRVIKEKKQQDLNWLNESNEKNNTNYNILGFMSKQTENLIRLKTAKHELLKDKYNLEKDRINFKMKLQIGQETNSADANIAVIVSNAMVNNSNYNAQELATRKISVDDDLTLEEAKLLSNKNNTSKIELSNEDREIMEEEKMHNKLLGLPPDLKPFENLTVIVDQDGNPYAVDDNLNILDIDISSLVIIKNGDEYIRKDTGESVEQYELE